MRAENLTRSQRAVLNMLAKKPVLVSDLIVHRTALDTLVRRKAVLIVAERATITDLGRAFHASGHF